VNFTWNRVPGSRTGPGRFRDRFQNFWNRSHRFRVRFQNFWDRRDRDQFQKFGPGTRSCSPLVAWIVMVRSQFVKRHDLSLIHCDRSVIIKCNSFFKCNSWAPLMAQSSPFSTQLISSHAIPSLEQTHRRETPADLCNTQDGKFAMRESLEEVEID